LRALLWAKFPSVPDVRKGKARVRETTPARRFSRGFSRSLRQSPALEIAGSGVSQHPSHIDDRQDAEKGERREQTALRDDSDNNFHSTSRTSG